jgi:hypothetical protein
LPRLLAYLLLALGVGALAGVLWWLAVDLPGYVVQPDGGATTSERELTTIVGADAWFTLIGAVAGAALGWLAWTRLRWLGWPVVPVAAVAALIAALLCWCVGYELGPSGFNERLAGARPGDTVPVELTLRARASLLVWPFLATLPILLGSSLGHDDEEPRPFFGDRATRRPLAPGPVFRRRSGRRPPTST